MAEKYIQEGIKKIVLGKTTEKVLCFITSCKIHLYFYSPQEFYCLSTM